MMLTRKEAGGTWCPMVRLAACTPEGGVTAGQAVFNRLQNGNETAIPDSGRCIADKCAMWRWSGPATEPREPLTFWPKDDFPEVEPARHADVPPHAEWIPMSGPDDDPVGGYWLESQATVDAENAAAAAGRRGYCGLAGAPLIGGAA